MVDRKVKFSILSYFQRGYSKATGGETLVMNKYSAQWDADALIESYGSDKLKEMIDYYFLVSEHPSWKGFCRDAQKVHESMFAEEQDRRWREIMKSRTREWLNE